MAGSITISTLNNDTGVLATQNGMTGIAKAWVNFDGVTTITVRDSFNVSSVVRNSAGNYTVNYTTAMPNANYACVRTSGLSITDSSWISASTLAQTTSAITFETGFPRSTGGSLTPADSPQNSVVIFSS